jgi:hypothetical protein
MGSIVDRSKEHLGPADRAVIQARRLLLDAVRAAAKDEAPRGVAPSYYTLHAAEAIIGREVDWRTLLAPEASAGRLLQTV